MVRHSFWQERWQTNETPWKGDRVNDVLVEFLPVLTSEYGIEPPAKALVPLCGDSPAVRLLYDAGFSVTGIEYVADAMESLRIGSFPEIAFGVKNTTALHAPRLELLVADFLAFSAPAQFSFAYDRAGYVALSEPDRAKYAEVIVDSLHPGGMLLSRTAELIGAPWEGPPFSVTLPEVTAAFAGLELLEHRFDDSAPTQARYTDAGITCIRNLTCVMQKPIS